MKCLSEKCSFYNGTMTGNCTNYIEVEKCKGGIIKPDNTFFLEWIPVTDKEKPVDLEEVLIVFSHDEGEDFGKGFYDEEEKEFCFPGDLFYNAKANHWARITLPGVEQ